MATSCGTVGAWAGDAGGGASAVVSALLNLSTSCFRRLYAVCLFQRFWYTYPKFVSSIPVSCLDLVDYA